MINITFKEILEMVTEDGKPTGYAVILNEKTRLGYITLFPDGWHIEKELENGYETITTCKTFNEAKKKAKLALTTDMIITRGCHRLQYKTLVDEVKKYKLNSRISVISYLIGRYNYIDNLNILRAMIMCCDFWECKHRDECIQAYAGYKYRPCASCTGFDTCEYCSHYIECCDLVVKWLPNMFRRLVREIRHGENLEPVQQYIRRNTHGGKRD